MSYIGKNPKFDSTILKDAGVASVSNPASSTNKIINRSGELFLKNSSGQEFALKSRAIADIATIKAIAATSRNNGDIAISLADNYVYLFDSGSSATGDDEFVLEPDAGSGRWIRYGFASTKTGQFDSISPLTTKGDLIGHDGSNNVRLGVGSNGQVLQSDSSASTGLSWVSVGTTFSQNLLGDVGYTVLDGDGYRNIVVGSTADLTTGRTVTLPTAADNANRVLSISKGDSSSNTVTVEGEGAEVIGPGGATSVILNNEGEGVTLVCDGTEWRPIPVVSEASTTNLGLVKKLSQNEVFVSGANGYGSTNNKIRRYTTTNTNSGSAITYADSSTNGASFTINEDGAYAIVVMDFRTAANSNTGFSINSAQLTTNIASVTLTDIGAYDFSVSGVSGHTSATIYLQSGDVVRPHDNGSNTTGGTTFFRITKVSV